MKFFSASVVTLFTFLSSAVVEAAPPSFKELDLRASTCNTPSNRACWTSGFNINTDYDANTPTTGVTRTYALTITEVDNWTGPDGVVKPKVMLVNGPTIFADWGDRINITVTNNLRTNGTSIHWHGLRQLGSNLHDGANGVTECPIPPKGGSKVYSFIAAQYGTSWYHSHFSAQYANGVVGSIQIEGPASLPYDIDLGVFPITDYYYRTADDLVEFTKNNGAPPSDNVLINGTNVHPVTGAGKYANVTLTPGKRHRLRLINPSVENHFQVSLVNHSMTVIAADLVPVNAYTTNTLFLGVGQRYDVTIDASKPIGNYWFNVTLPPNGFCGTSNHPAPAAIFHYAGAPGGLPTNPGTPPVDTLCYDNTDLVPVVSRTAAPGNFNPNPNNSLPVHLDTTGSPLFVWQINGSSINVNWNKPVLQYVIEGNTSYPPSENIISVPSNNQYSYWLIENDLDAAFSLPHPFHLHGHDFLILGRSPVASPVPPQTRYKFNPATDLSLLRGSNPTRRDVTMLPAKGWLLIAFRTDNPGAWLMHCHIAWHVSGGLSVDFLEGVSTLRNNLPAADKAAFADNCNKWRAYFPSMDPFPKSDSGI
ncbi:benzenediol:oxygen oxidoreductase [Coniochaeta sp. 2T2.1]|nr:benzenediol:oxygen oxidoreductase [Coniochaeta sp. 2T2.1]